MPDTRLDKRVGQIGAISERIREKDGADTFRTLSDRIKKLNEEKTPLSLQEAEQLLMLYARCGVQLKKKYDATASAKPEEASYYLKLMKKMTKDYMAMNRYHNRLKAYQEEGKAVKPLTIEQFYDLSKTRTISLNGKSMSELEAVGDGVNVRYKVSVPYKDEALPFPLSKGDTFNAYFTENVSYAPETSDAEILFQKEQKIVRHVEEQFPALKGLLGSKNGYANSRFFKELFKLEGTNIGEYLRNSVEQNIAVIGTGEMLKNFKSLLGPRSKEAKDILNTISAEGDPYKKQEMIYGLVTYTSAVMKALFERNVRRGNGIDLTTAMGKRNALMSDMAEIFGCSEEVAFSEKVNLRTVENGNEVLKSGVIMMPAAGEDLAHAGLSGRLADMDRTKLEESPKLTRSIARLQFLDLLCGNSDRHRCNCFYRFDEKGKLIGVQGIDNDTSFGSKEMTWKIAGYAVDFTDLKIIPKSMADAVKKMDKETFSLLLQGYDLKKEEIQTAVNRFHWVQKQLKKVEKAYEGVEPGALAQGTPRIVPDEEMHLYSFNEQLLTKHEPKPIGSHNNLFTLVKETSEDRQKSLLAQIQNSNSDVLFGAYDFTKGFFEKGRNSLTGNLELMERQNAGMKKKDKDFETMLKDTRELLSTPKIWGSILAKSAVSAGNPQFGGQELLLLKEGKRLKGAVPAKEATLKAAVREVLDTELYKKMDKALESTYQFLAKDSSVAIAEKYQMLQMELSEAPKDQRAGIVEKLNTLKESGGFKRYMAAVKNRDKLQEQMERYVKIRETSDELLKAAARYDAFFRPDACIDPYEGSKMQQDAIKRKNAAKAKAKQQLKANEKKLQPKKAAVMGH